MPQRLWRCAAAGSLMASGLLLLYGTPPALGLFFAGVFLLLDKSGD